MLIDGHCHVASTRFIPEGFFEGIARNIYARALAYKKESLSKETILKYLLNQHRDHNADQLVREMDEAGIVRSVLLLPDFTYVFEHNLNIIQMAEEHRKIMERHPDRFYLFAGVDPRHAGAVETFRSLVVDYNLAGMKIYPPCGFSSSSEVLFPFYEICNQYDLPVLLHTGPTAPTLEFQYSPPEQIEVAARTFPKVNFILGHGGVNNMETCSLLCAYRDNIYLDFSAFTSSHHPAGWQHQLSILFRSGINHKVIFGTDWPVAKGTGGLKSTMSQLLHEDGPFKDISAEDRALILGGNMLRILPPRVTANHFC